MKRILLVLLVVVISCFGIVWSLSEPSSTQAAKQAEFELRALQTLPYLGAAPMDSSRSKHGVTTYVSDQAYKGMNFFNSTLSPRAYLIDMNGRVLHTWEATFNQKNSWQHTHLNKDGSILAVSKDNYLAKIRWDSTLHWKVKGRFHHEVSVGPDGRIYTLRRSEKMVRSKESSEKLPNTENFPIIDDMIEVFSPEGKLLSSLSVFDLVGNRVRQDKLERAYLQAKKKNLTTPIGDLRYKGPELIEDSRFDVLHTNRVKPIEETVFDGCHAGDLIISVRNINLIGCVDSVAKELRWSWGPSVIMAQHHPTILKNGNILIFDNRPSRRHSRVIELDPKTSKIVWSAGRESLQFFSHSRGSAQRLPNGNTLISESDYGRIMEVTQNHDVVWVYYNTEKPRSGEGNAALTRGTFYRFRRLVNPEKVALISALL